MVHSFGSHSKIEYSGNKYRSPEPAWPDVLLPYGVNGDVNSKTTDLYPKGAGRAGGAGGL